MSIRTWKFNWIKITVNIYTIIIILYIYNFFLNKKNIVIKLLNIKIKCLFIYFILNRSFYSNKSLKGYIPIEIAKLSNLTEL